MATPSYRHNVRLLLGSTLLLTIGSALGFVIADACGDVAGSAGARAAVVSSNRETVNAGARPVNGTAESILLRHGQNDRAPDLRFRSRRVSAASRVVS